MAKRQHSPDYQGGHSYVPLGRRRTMMSKERTRALRNRGFTNNEDAYFSEAHASASAIFRTVGLVNSHLEDFYRTHEWVQCPELIAVQHFTRETERRILEDLVPRLPQDFPDYPESPEQRAIQPPVPDVPEDNIMVGEEPPVNAQANQEASPAVLNAGMDIDDVIPPANAALESHEEI